MSLEFEADLGQAEQLKAWSEIAVWAAKLYIVGQYAGQALLKRADGLFTGALFAALDKNPTLCTEDDAAALNRLANDCLAHANDGVGCQDSSGVIRTLYTFPPVNQDAPTWRFESLIAHQTRVDFFPEGSTHTIGDYQQALARLSSTLLDSL